MTTTLSLIQDTNISGYDSGDFTRVRGFASNTTGTIFYVAIVSYGIIKSTNSGVSWSDSYTSGGITSVACSSDGVIVYGAQLGYGLVKSTDSGASWTMLNPGGSPLPAGVETNVGYDTQNIYQIACDSTGTNIIMTTNYAAVIYRSTDGGSTWSNMYTIPNYSTNPQKPTLITSNKNGSVIYAAFNNTDQNLYKSTNNGSSWTQVNTSGVTGPYAGLSTNLAGDFIFVSDGSGYLNIVYATHADKSVLIPVGGSLITACMSYNNGNNIILMQNNATQTYLLGLQYPPAPPPQSLVCFAEGTRVLTQHGYKAIETLVFTDLIVTSDNRTIDFVLNKIPFALTDKTSAPYRIEAGAFGVNMPSADMCLSPIHKIQLRKGVWISPERAALTNPKVYQYGVGKPINYWHIACKDYLKDNLVCEGMVVESLATNKNYNGPKKVYTWSDRLGGFTRVGVSVKTKASI